MSDDFPTLDRPINATSGRPSVGHCSKVLLLVMNSAEVICISLLEYLLHVVGEVGECIGESFEVVYDALVSILLTATDDM